MGAEGSLNEALLAWARAGGRELDVRAASTPWAVLVSEVMSQQTQIDRIAGPWRSFIDRWPTAAQLATAETGELLRAWAGLGYNRRALALRAAARRIVERHEGRVPVDLASLEALPGVGPYTARAVAAAAFGCPVAPLDVNVRRVVERIAGQRLGGRAGQAAADAMVAHDDPRAWVNAVMDLAATVCIPARPACDACPVASWCASRGRVTASAFRTAPARSRPSRPAPRFVATRRWLRGRLVARLREATPGTWVRFDTPVGTHSVDAVRGALEALEREGFVAVRGDEARLA